MLKGNKGEWSEVYTFFKLLADGKLHGADADLNKKDDIFYDIIKVIRSEEIGTLHFVLDRDKKVVDVQNDDGELKVSIGSEEFKNQSEILYDKITNNKGLSFEVLETTEFMKEILCSKLKAPSADKSDITIKVHDFNTGLNPTLGFSIKSRLGKPSTLLNAGINTNFIFEIQGDMNDRQKITDKEGIYRIDDSGIAMKKYLICPTLKANMGTYHDRVPVIRDDYGVRKLTPRECLDFQGFPKDFHFKGISLVSAYKQAGNTVCVPVIKKIARELKY